MFFSIWELTCVKFSASVLIIKPKCEGITNNATIIIFCLIGGERSLTTMQRGRLVLLQSESLSPMTPLAIARIGRAKGRSTTIDSAKKLYSYNLCLFIYILYILLLQCSPNLVPRAFPLAWLMQPKARQQRKVNNVTD